jgi:hypothetical protein
VVVLVAVWDLGMLQLLAGRVVGAVVGAGAVCGGGGERGKSLGGVWLLGLGKMPMTRSAGGRAGWLADEASFGATIIGERARAGGGCAVWCSSRRVCQTVLGIWDSRTLRSQGLWTAFWACSRRSHTQREAGRRGDQSRAW